MYGITFVNWILRIKSKSFEYKLPHFKIIKRKQSVIFTSESSTLQSLGSESILSKKDEPKSNFLSDY